VQANLIKTTSKLLRAFLKDDSLTLKLKKLNKDLLDKKTLNRTVLDVKELKRLWKNKLTTSYEEKESMDQ